MAFITSEALAETGYVVLDDHDQSRDPAEWLDLQYIGWRSSGITRFAPLASYAGDLECNGFWNHTPPRTDKDGVWVPSQVALAPTLQRRALEPGAPVGRCRVIELQPNEYADAIYNLHQDDNNRLNDEGTGWVVRGYYNLTDDRESMLILRSDRFDPATEIRLPLGAGSRIIVDTQRFWHAVWHRGTAPRYALITSWTSGPEPRRVHRREPRRPASANRRPRPGVRGCRADRAASPHRGAPSRLRGAGHRHGAPHPALRLSVVSVRGQNTP